LEYAKLGSSGLLVSRIGFGCEQLGGVDWGDTDIRAVSDAVRRALDMGITLFDTADVYALGGSERELANALGDARQSVVITTKVGVNWVCERPGQRARTYFDLSPKRVVDGLEASLRRLRLETIPLYLLHWPDPQTPLEETMAALERAQRAGKIRHVGVSNFTPHQIRIANSVVRLSAVEVQYNLLDRSPESEIFPCCRELGIGVLVYGPLAQGLLTGKYGKHNRFPVSDRRSRLPHFQGQALERHLKVLYRLHAVSQRLGDKSLAQIALRWILSQPDVTSVIAGVKSERQIEDNAGASNWQLSSVDALYLTRERD